MPGEEKTKKKALGAGLDALFQGDQTPPPSPDPTPLREIDSTLLRSAVTDAQKNPRITLWSPVASALFRYLRKTTPEFSMSDASSALLDEALQAQYPELYARVKKELGE